ncbi:NTE family protein [Arthrobacter stackebrandtii]|uniref:NTE family protein n=1 Tax=Arthrobacter stackebrandtii TaxID=272161 RepID=A0ABS4Z189_9MICC|nr:patatin-like phospholipase family protein [Arthrobacter stackebrandtii]MBP2414739.1 NTE family protein [Arthrobacter stackebrandtii]PYG98662.1 patatin [Arthrobacter stackebrandtii]
MNSTFYPTLPADPAAASQRALVLGGGGSAGNAWLVGVLAGLFDAGVDTAAAGLIVGTSAGATAAAQASATSPLQLFEDILAAPVTPRPVDGTPGSGTGGRGSAAENMRRTGEVIAASADPADMRRRMGASALTLGASHDAGAQAKWRAAVASRFPNTRWPRWRILLTAVNAGTGEPVVFDANSDVDLVDAVAASCAGSFAYSIGGVPYIDGGYRRNSENADLAAGFGRVLVLSPLGGRTRHPRDWGMQLDAQVEDLLASGSRVASILPDSGSLEAFGSNMMDLSARPASARAGFDQGKAAAANLAGFWG